MEIIDKDGVKVIKCVHCGGTGICKHATAMSSENLRWYECPKCGKGIPIPKSGHTEKPPVCAVCGGKGYNR